MHDKKSNKIKFDIDETQIEELMIKLTLEEKFKLLSGRQRWYTKPIKNLGFPSLNMTDGPHGIAPHSSGEKLCTYFPTGTCRTSTWNPQLSEKFGIALAQEVRDIGYHIILGPAINIIRTPLCGRNFEYQTEDPFLNSILAVSIVKGIQSQRIAACVKHYACNNQEVNRFKVNAIVSERGLQEIYLPAYKATVIEADAWAFMSCYNKVNGRYGSEHQDLLKNKLMNEWGFQGFVMTDWGATAYCLNPENCLNAGLSLEMPRAIMYKKNLLTHAYEERKFTDETLNENIKRILRVMSFVGLLGENSNIPKGSRNTKEHQEIAKKIALEGITLLKNQDNLLPLNLGEIRKIMVLGPNADSVFGEGGGSSSVRPPYEITPLQGIKKVCTGKSDLTNDPKESDVIIYVAGFNHEQGNDSESTDRTMFNLPAEQVIEINDLASINANLIVVLISGGPIGMAEWLEKVPCVIEMWYAGMEGGNALAEILFGRVSPSGKLPVTFPRKLTDSPAHKSIKTYPGDDDVYYDEDIYVGYRYFDKENIDPLFPFGFGLSYSSFKMDNITLDNYGVRSGECLTVNCKVRNEGRIYGGEVVQLYIQDVEASVSRPLKELKGFQKVFLSPGEETIISFKIDPLNLSFFDESSHSWKVEPGTFKILLGNSSRNIQLEEKFEYYE
jgi:beta-glucosidase